MKLLRLRHLLFLAAYSGVLFAAAWCGAPQAAAQVPPPNRQSTFAQDSSTQKKQDKEFVRKATQGIGAPAPGVDFQAPIIDFDRNKNEVTGKGGVTISDSGVQVQADQGTFNTETREGVVSGNVVVSSSAGVLGADTATLKIPNETGEFSKLDFEVEDGGFEVFSERAKKVSEFDFELEDSSITSCHCADGAKPWELRSDSCKITQEAYAHTYGTSFHFEGLPVFYTPYLAFPVKNERASGLMPPQWGMSNQNGFLFRQPILGIIDDSTDVTLQPFIATKSRVGAEVELQKVFSKTHNLRSGFLYSNESLRGDSLRGLNVSGTYDPTIDTNRTGGYYKQRWTPDPKLDLPVEFVADGRYTSDNLFLREIPEPDIGDKTSQFLTSTAVLRGRVFEAINAEARAEYNQMLLTNPEVQTQRLPEVSASTGQIFRPFGFNPYGAKLVLNEGVTGTDFYRQDGYDGLRADIVPKAAVPFHIANYMKAQLSAELHQTQYNLNETKLPSTATPLPDGSTELDSSMSRTLPILNYNMSSGVERTFQVDRGDLFSRLANLGAKNERSELVRLKHTIEPTIGYTYIPDVDQQYNPLFDQIDRYRQRSLVSYGFSSRLYGRFMTPYERLRPVEELSPSGQSLPMVDLGSSVLDFGRNMIVAPTQNIDPRAGEIRQLAMFNVQQTYDLTKTAQSTDPALDKFSDLGLGFSVSPSNYLSSGVQTNYGTSDSTFHSYSFSLGAMDDREDMIRARYTYIMDMDPTNDPPAGEPNPGTTEQLEANAEFAIHPRLRAGGYIRYDASQSKVIESRALVRFINSCRCWSADFGIGETNNPDNKQALFSFTFGGLGGITQGIGLPTQGGQK